MVLPNVMCFGYLSRHICILNSAKTTTNCSEKNVVRNLINLTKYYYNMQWKITLVQFIYVRAQCRKLCKRGHVCLSSQSRHLHLHLHLHILRTKFWNCFKLRKTFCRVFGIVDMHYKSSFETSSWVHFLIFFHTEQSIACGLRNRLVDNGLRWSAVFTASNIKSSLVTR